MEQAPQAKDPSINADLNEAIRARDHLAVRRALDNGASVYVRLSEGGGYPLDSILLGVGATEHDKMEDFTQLVREIFAEEKPGMTLPGRSTFLAKSLSIWGYPGIKWALSFGREPFDLAFSSSSFLGVRHSLFDIAVRFGQEEAALCLWDKHGVGPKSAGADIPIHASPLGLVFRNEFRGEKFPERLWERFLEIEWAKEDLDEALSESIKKGNLRAAEQLLEKGASPNRRPDLHGPSSTTELPRRISSLTHPHMPGLISLLFKFGARLDEEVGYDVSFGGVIQYLQSTQGTLKVKHTNVQVLGLAASAGRVENVEELLGLGADIHHRSAQGNTPLHLAASGASESGQESIMAIASLLMEAGADILAVNHKGYSPLEEWAVHLPPEENWRTFSSQTLEIANEWMKKTLDADPKVGQKVADILKDKSHPLAQSALRAFHAWEMKAKLPAARVTPSRSGPGRL